tara:strand:+ start:505 stop:1410 length:906 start_codon:yes stop_codon:yes gene_type:complete
MQNTKTIIHIGANKTASTLFQKKIFSKYKNILHFGEWASNYDFLKKNIQNIIYDDDYYYDYNDTISKFSSFVKVENTHTVFSSEDILMSRKPTLVAKRLKKIFPNAKVLMLIRNQIDCFISWYLNHGCYLTNVPKKFWKRYLGLNDWLEYCFENPTFSPLQAMNYLKYYEIFSNFFGEENIILIPYEEIFHNRLNFCKKFSSLFGVSADDVQKILNLKENKRNTKLKYLIHKNFGFSNKLPKKLYSFISFLDFSGSANIQLSKIWSERIFNEYAEKNYLLTKRTGLNLEIYNYPLKKNNEK